jgi:hypothetical protein
LPLPLLTQLARQLGRSTQKNEMNPLLIEILDFTKSLLTPLLAIIGTTILILQYKLASYRWKLDLYDKRYPVYTATLDYIAFVVREGKMTHEAIFTFIRESQDKDFLFGTEIKEYIEELRKNGADLRAFGKKISHLSDGEEKSQLIDKECEMLTWFGNQFEVAKILFGNYLKIDKK